MLTVLLLGLGIPFILSIPAAIYVVWDDVRMDAPSRRYQREVRAVQKVEVLDAAPAKRAAISAAMRAEIDQTTEWWDSQYHLALIASGSPAVENPFFEPEYKVYYNGRLMQQTLSPPATWVEDCPCQPCKAAWEKFKRDSESGDTLQRYKSSRSNRVLQLQQKRGMTELEVAKEFSDRWALDKKRRFG